MERDSAHLKELLRNETRAVERLVVLLGQERDALTGRDIDAIERVTQAKIEQIGQVEHASAARESWARTAGVAFEGRAFEQLVTDMANAANDAELVEVWEKLREAMREAHRENLVNGRVISRSRQTLSHLLDILRGQVDAPRLYGRAGQTGSLNEGGEIARA